LCFGGLEIHHENLDQIEVITGRGVHSSLNNLEVMSESIYEGEDQSEEDAS